MTLLRVALALVSAGVVNLSAQETKSAGKPAVSTETAVLSRFVGTWDITVTNRPAGGDPVTYKARSVRTWDDIGKAVRFEDEQPNDRPPIQMTLRHDADVGSYPMAISTGENTFQLVGSWNAKTATMEFFGALPNGPDLSVSHRFVNETKAIVTARITNAEGSEVGNLVFVQKLRKKAD